MPSITDPIGLLDDVEDVKHTRELLKLFGPNELRDAHLNLTDEQRQAIEGMSRIHSVSGIACRLGLTRSYVQSYIRQLNCRWGT